MGSARRVVTCLAIVFVLFSFSYSEARNYRLSWKIPSKPDWLNHWASKMRFLIGDSLEFKFDPKGDSVLQVTEQNYKTCNISNPIKSYDKGDTKIVLDHSGQYFYISGADRHCEKGQKMMVWVLSAKHGIRGHNETAAPAASPAKAPAHAMSTVAFQAPAPAPSDAVRVKGGGVLVVTSVVVSLVGLVLGGDIK